MSYNQSSRSGILKSDYFSGDVSPGTFLGVNQAASPRSTPKSVSISAEPELISPLILGGSKDVDELDLDRNPRKPRVKGPMSRRLSGRPSQQSSISSFRELLDGSIEAAGPDADQDGHDAGMSTKLISQISSWVKDERQKKARRRAKRKGDVTPVAHADDHPSTTSANGDLKDHHHHHLHRLHFHRRRRSSSGSEDEVDLEKLEQILRETFAPQRPLHRGSSISLRQRPSSRKLHKASSAVGASSDTEYLEGDAVVPSTDACLDNSKTLAYGSGASQSTEDLALRREVTAAEEAWYTFKFEIVRLTHTLRLKGWRRIPMEMSNEIQVERLSGALTNAVYVVHPPKDLPSRPSTASDEPRSTFKKPPQKLLLRIYGPQVEHLIDREAELQILKRLARKRIGPRMLGTFGNGRFEEYFHASPLTPQDLRNIETGRQIAKRMRELHDGIELLESEREKGPFVWQNWDKWMARVEEIVTFLDDQVREHGRRSSQSGPDATRERGYICGTEWRLFKDTLFRYRSWLKGQYGGSSKLRQELVFAHNDTQYGNILRVLPAGTSPLLLPANTHKQLIVIDFEYASANTPGLEFANHFTEWCYNYHDQTYAWRCNTSFYPNIEEQTRFIRAYARHRPSYNIQTPLATPVDKPSTTSNSSSVVSLSSAAGPEHDSYRPGSAEAARRPQGLSQSISNFMLDARTPTSSSSVSSIPTSASGITSATMPGPARPAAFRETSELQELDADEETQVQRLLLETRKWRLANSAQWVAWGIVQAKVPGMARLSSSASAVDADTATADADLAHKTASLELKKQSSDDEEENLAEMKQDEEEEAKEEEFDYLSYARDRAMFFWGDAVAMGLVKLEDLPADVRRDIKILRY